MPEERLQKIIANAGIASRRHAEQLITSGVVQVNGKTVTELGAKADPERDHIKVSRKLIKPAGRKVYLLLNKPRGYVTTVSDPEGRETVMDLIRGVPERVYPVGRLDYNSEGLLLLTNDGGLANKLTHASSNVAKTYVVKIAGQPSEEQIQRLRQGIRIGGTRSPRKPGKSADEASAERRSTPHAGSYRQALKPVVTAPARIRQIREGENPWYEVSIIEGRNRQIRRMFEEIGHHVEKIRRVKYGPLELDVEPGKWRPLEAGEVKSLQSAASGRAKDGGRKPQAASHNDSRTRERRPSQEGRRPQPASRRREDRPSPDSRRAGSDDSMDSRAKRRRR